MKHQSISRIAASGVATIAALALGGAVAAPASAATPFTRCSSPDGVARTLKVHGVSCREGRTQAKAWQRAQGEGDQGARFTLRGYRCRMRSIQTTAGDPDGTGHFDCRRGTRRIVWTYHP
ncbi:hypothetical protein [Patulibacter sp.]|uniref:hypothetical protein n=1 Tax=Patulibacter sp. TaxID=1912859 RepID=UPI0027232B8F|nr:hypothetical protein [Patulibacter sp.]MDO9407202.1 hypothetical protein [Patulibacter sp.]